MIKKGNDKKRSVDSQTRVQLIRKGNEFFTTGDIPAAEKIFLTTDYKDGLVRLGDYYMEKRDIEKACDMYFKSENSSKIEDFCKYSAKVIQRWLKEDDDDAIVDKIIITN